MRYFWLHAGKAKKAILPETHAFFFDIHDTLLKTEIVKGKEVRSLLPGAKEILSALLKESFQVRLLTNLTTGRVSALLKPFYDAGIDLKRNQLLTSADMAVTILRGKNIKALFVIGRKELQSFFSEEGFEVLYPHADAEVEKKIKEGLFAPVVIGFPYPYSLLQEQLRGVVKAVELGMPVYILDNKATVFLNNTLYPGERALASFILSAAGRKRHPLYLTGKPSPLFFKKAFQSLSLPQLQAVFMIGDSPQTDFCFPKSLPFVGVGVLTGSLENRKILKNMKLEDRSSSFYLVESLSEIYLEKPK